YSSDGGEDLCEVLVPDGDHTPLYAPTAIATPPPALPRSRLKQGTPHLHPHHAGSRHHHHHHLNNNSSAPLPPPPPPLVSASSSGTANNNNMDPETKSSSDSDHSVGGLRTASLDRMARRSHAHPPTAHHAHGPHYSLPRRPQHTQRLAQPHGKGKGYGYSPPAAVFDDDPGIMSEAETSSTGFRRGGKQRASLPPARSPSSKTLDARSFESDANSSFLG
ncbi:hypothetical protein O3P69_016551, partial [Scylla paramamosain]